MAGWQLVANPRAITRERRRERLYKWTAVGDARAMRCDRPRAAYRAHRCTMLGMLTGALAWLLTSRCAAQCALSAPPEQLYEGLFVEAQTGQVFKDQKTFVDLVPKETPARILEAFRERRPSRGGALATFVKEHFTLSCGPVITPPSDQSLSEHIVWLWPRLTRQTTTVPADSSLLALPYPYVVPGGRFREVYYWDSYFTMLGLESSGRTDLVDAMLKNFAHEIDCFGHVPNGNRSYYLSRSQPPFFSHMVELAATHAGPAIYRSFLTQLKREHAYWMHGQEVAQERAKAAGQASAEQRVVAWPDGTVLNRHWDDRDIPRSESYLDDVRTARKAKRRKPEEVYRDLRAAAETGWDFSSRWFGDGGTLASIVTTHIVPVDLNSLLYHLEKTIERGCKEAQDRPCEQAFAELARRRAESIHRYLWNDHGYYGDYDWQRGKQRDNLTAATLYPLFVGLAEPERARSSAQAVQKSLLKAGGLATTTYATGEQWDAPNGWAPLQWIAVVGLTRYEQRSLAEQIGTRFLRRVRAVFACDRKLIEKYDVEVENAADAVGRGGEYPLQDGFGWTNGVTLKLLERYPAAADQASSECQRSPRARKRAKPRAEDCPPSLAPELPPRERAGTLP